MATTKPCDTPDPTSPQPKENEASQQRQHTLAVFIREEIDPGTVVGYLNAICIDHGLVCTLDEHGSDAHGLSGEAKSNVDESDPKARQFSAAETGFRLKWTAGRHKTHGNLLLVSFETGERKRVAGNIARVGKATLNVTKAAGAALLGTLALATGAVIAWVSASGDALILGAVGLVLGFQTAGESLATARAHLRGATPTRSMTYLYNRGTAASDTYGVPPGEGGDGIPVVFPVHSFEDETEFAQYFFANTATFLSNIQATRVRPDTGLVWPAPGGLRKRGRPSKALIPGAASIPDHLPFLCTRVFEVDLPKDLAMGTVLRVEVAASASVHLRVKKGRPPTRLTPSTIQARQVGHKTFGATVGSETKPALTPGRWYVAVSAVSAVDYACQLFGPKFSAHLVEAMTGAAAERTVVGAGALGPDEDEWELIEAAAVSVSPLEGGEWVGPLPSVTDTPTLSLTQGSDLYDLTEGQLRDEILERSGQPASGVASGDIATLAGILFPLLPPAGLAYRPILADGGRLLTGEHEGDPPQWLLCPISFTLFEDPVFTADGQTYERASIDAWFDQGHQTSPLTNMELPHTKLIPNFAMRRVVDGFKRSQRPLVA